MVGTIGYNNQGTRMKIIAERNRMDIDVEFLDEHHYIKRNSTMSNWKNGCIKNPYDKSIFGIGYIGDGKYMTQVDGKKQLVYQVWVSMIERCCVEEKRDKHKAYEKSELCLEWHNYQNFAEWFENNSYDIGNERLHLDKDIMYKGNTIYSPYHCILVPQIINEQFKSHSGREKKIDTDLPYTIRRTATGYSATYRGKTLGIYKTVDECISVYLSKKKEYLNELVDRYDTMPNYIKEIILNTNR